MAETVTGGDGESMSGGQAQTVAGAGLGGTDRCGTGEQGAGSDSGGKNAKLDGSANRGHEIPFEMPKSEPNVPAATELLTC